MDFVLLVFAWLTLGGAWVYLFRLRKQIKAIRAWQLWEHIKRQYEVRKK
jgi:hypothetical protein